MKMTEHIDFLSYNSHALALPFPFMISLIEILLSVSSNSPQFLSVLFVLTIMLSLMTWNQSINQLTTK